MSRSIHVVPVFFAAFLFIGVPLCMVSTNVLGQEAGRTVKPLTEADLVALIGRQADDQAILRRIEKQKLAFTMDAATLARLKEANPSPAVLAALGKFLPVDAATQRNAIAPKGAWERQDSGVKEYLRDVAFINDEVGVAVGDRATVIRTTDG